MLGGLAVGGCSLTTSDHALCIETADCRAEFGTGWVCGAEGLCSQVASEAHCNQVFPPGITEDPDALILGSIFDRGLDTQQAREQAAQLAIRQANDEGGLDGRRLGVVQCSISDRADDPKRASTVEGIVAHLVAAYQVPAIIGPSSSADVQTAVLAGRDSDFVLISPSASSPTLSSLDPTSVSDAHPGRIWRTTPPDSLQGLAIARDMLDPGVGRQGASHTVAVLYREGTYGESLAAIFAEEFQAGGGTAEISVFTTDEQMERAIVTIAKRPVDEVLFISSEAADVIRFLNHASSLSGFDDKGIFLTDSAANPDILAGADRERFPQIRGTRPALPDASSNFVYAGFLAAFDSEYGHSAEQFSYAAHAFDAAWLVAYGMAWAHLQEGGVTGQAIARGLRHVSDGTSIEIRQTSWHPAWQQLAAGSGINVEGASGSLDFDPRSEELGARIETWVIQGSELVGVDQWPKTP